MISPRYVILTVPYEEGQFQPWEFDVPASLKADAEENGRILLKIDVNNGYIYDWPGEQPDLEHYWTIEHSGSGTMEIRSEDMQLLASADHMVDGPLCVREGVLLIRGLGANAVNVRFKKFGDEWNWIVPEANPAYMPEVVPGDGEGDMLEMDESVPAVPISPEFID